MSISPEKARAIIESALAPYLCQCEEHPDGLRLSIHEGSLDLPPVYVTHLDPTRIQSVRSIAQLLIETRQHVASLPNRQHARKAW